MLPVWGSSFRNGHREAIRSDKLDYKEVAASLYDEADVQNILKKQTPRVQKGAFGPTSAPDDDKSTPPGDESETQSTDQRRGQKEWAELTAHPRVRGRFHSRCFALA